jgi:hypothetical protein
LPADDAPTPPTDDAAADVGSAAPEVEAPPTPLADDAAADVGSAAPGVEAAPDAAADVETDVAIPVTGDTGTAPEVVAEVDVDTVDTPEAGEAPDDTVSEVALETSAGGPSVESPTEPVEQG